MILICSSELLQDDTHVRFNIYVNIIININNINMHAKSLQSCLILCDPMNCSPPGSCYSPGKNTGVGCHFLLQGIFLRVETASPVAPALQVDSLPLSYQGSSINILNIYYSIFIYNIQIYIYIYIWRLLKPSKKQKVLTEVMSFLPLKYIHLSWMMLREVLRKCE